MKYFVRTTLERKLDSSYNQIEYELLVDREHNARKSFVEQLEYLATLNEDVVILEDDLILCRNFKQRIEEVINQHKEDVINFFYNPENWFTTHLSDTFCWNQCVYYPNNKLKLLAKEMRHQYTLYPTVAHDVVENRALRMLNMPNLTYRPCLVQHLDLNSLVGNNCFNRRTPYFIDYLDELGIIYDDAYKKENKDKLNDLMKRKFKDISLNN